MNVAIIGYGFVGKALHSGIKENTNVFLVDPNLNTNIEELEPFKPSIIFVCVPTPMNDDGSQDISILKRVFKEIDELSNNPVIVLKSTVLPNYVAGLEKLNPNLVYNPEFLKERSANQDFVDSDLIIFGGKNEQVKKIEDFYSKYTHCICDTYINTDILSASFIKYTINSFLATKVIFFNELNSLFKTFNTETSWEDFINIVSRDKRMGDTHMSVPGPDGRYGYGGACFPKDTAAFSNFGKKSGNKLNLLDEAIKINKVIRNQYGSLHKREIDQNINFDSDND